MISETLQMSNDEYRCSSNRPSASTSSNDSGCILTMDINKLETDSAYPSCQTKDKSLPGGFLYKTDDNDNQQKYKDENYHNHENENNNIMAIKSSRSCSITSSNQSSDLNNHKTLDDDDADADNNSTVYDSDSDYIEDFVQETRSTSNNHTKTNQTAVQMINNLNENQLEQNGGVVIDQQIIGHTNNLTASNFGNGVNINALNFSGTNTGVTIGTKFVCHELVVKQYMEKSPKNRRKLENGNDNSGFDQEHDQYNNSTKSQTNGQPDFILEIPKRFECNLKAVIITVAAIIVIIFSIITITAILLLNKESSGNHKTGDGDDSRKNIPINSSIGSDIIAPGSVFRFVARDEWIAQPPNDELTDLVLPSNRVVIAHTATEGCTTQAVCTFRTRFIQTFHMESRGFDDIAYNFLVGGDGAVYEARGWDKQGAHSKGFNEKTICIAFIGTFIKIIPPDGQLNAAKLLIEEGVKLGKLSKDYQLYGHRQFIPSESPGDALYNIIKTWPHFSTDLPEQQ